MAQDAMVEVVRSRLGELELACELQLVSSVLDFDEAQGIRLVDPAPQLGQRPCHDGHVAYVQPEAGAPVGICLGEVRGFEAWTSSDVRRLPRWLTAFLPATLRPGCGVDGDDIVWLLDLRRLMTDA